MNKSKINIKGEIRQWEKREDCIKTQFLQVNVGKR